MANLSSILSVLKDFFTDPIFLACISSWFSAQFIKTVLNVLYGRIHSLHELLENLIWKTGGLPSSHSALVTSLCTCIGFKDCKEAFLVSLVFFMVTVRDAVGVRRSSGLQAKKLNELGSMLKEKGVIDEYKPIKEVQGHTPLEVAFGILLGFFIGLAFSTL